MFVDFFLETAVLLKRKIDKKRTLRRWEQLKNKGMKIGENVNIPNSTWIDNSHCYLITIEDNCGFGENCAILAHDAMPNEYINATRIGKVTIRESCHFGMGTIILPGVTIGPRSIVGSGSVVIKDIPPETVAAGNPAKMICSLDTFLQRNTERMRQYPLFHYLKYDEAYLTPERKKEMLEKLDKSDGYMVGGYTATRRKR